MGKKLYQQDAKGIRFVSDRRPGEVRIPNYVFDLWLPLLGATYIGVYCIYCRLERQEDVKGISNQEIARLCRIGTSKLGEINKALEDLGFIKTSKPTGSQKLRHFTTVIRVCDPPKEVTLEIIAKYGNPETYEPISTWLVEDTTNSQMGFNHDSQFPNGNADDLNWERDTIPNGNAKFEPSIVEPPLVEIAAPKRKRDLVFEAIGYKIFELSSLEGISGSRIGKLASIARKVMLARIATATEEQIAEYVTRFAATQPKKQFIQGNDTFELNFARFVELQHVEPTPSSAPPPPAEPAPTLTPEQVEQRIMEYNRIMAELNETLVEKVVA